jgi:hypothetical protein
MYKVYIVVDSYYLLLQFQLHFTIHDILLKQCNAAQFNCKQ